jgi:hypothetical protein
MSAPLLNGVDTQRPGRQRSRDLQTWLEQGIVVRPNASQSARLGQDRIADIDFYCALLVSIVHHQQQALGFFVRSAPCLTLEITQVNHRTIIAENVHVPAAPQRGMQAPQLKQALKVSEYLLLVGGSAGRGKGLAPVSGKASGEIAPVIRIAAPWHSDLVSSIDLRNPAEGEEKIKSQVQLFWSRARLAHEARVIVIAKKSHEPIRM